MNYIAAAFLATLLTLFTTTLAQAQECRVKADIVFVIDESISIDNTEYALQSAFIAAVIAKFTVGFDDVRFGAVRFSSGASVRFYLDTFYDKDEMLNDVNSWRQENGYTNHKAGFLVAKDVLDANGNRPGIQDIVVFLSDGDPSRARFNGSNEADIMKDIGVKIVAVSIGDEIKENYMMDYATHSSLHVMIEDFDNAVNSIDTLQDLICQTIPMDDPPQCVRCKDWDDTGFGFLADAQACTVYFTCYVRKNNKVVQVQRMSCPVGTMFDINSAKLGVPCVHGDDTCPEANLRGTTPQTGGGSGGNGGSGGGGGNGGKCPYTTDPSDHSQFGVMKRKQLIDIQTCGEGVAFNDTDGICRCIFAPGDKGCNCAIKLDFEGDIQDHSCTRGTVFNSHPRVTLRSGAARFRGYRRHMDNGPHLAIHVIDGAFSTTCDGRHGQHTLTVALWFRYDYAGDDADKLAGLVSYCDMTNGRAMFIEIRGNIVCAGLKTLEHNIASNCTERTITIGEWYYVAMVYEDPAILLYLTTEADYPTCGSDNPGDTCEYEATAFQEGCVEPRNCGFDVGSGGGGVDDHYFVGLMDDVQVSRDARFSGCG